MTSALTSLSPEALFHSSEVFSRQNDHISAAIALAAAVRSHHPRAHAALSWLLQEGRLSLDYNYEASYPRNFLFLPMTVCCLDLE
jgi:hypothetical protein